MTRNEFIIELSDRLDELAELGHPYWTKIHELLDVRHYTEISDIDKSDFPAVISDLISGIYHKNTEAAQEIHRGKSLLDFFIVGEDDDGD